MSLVGRGNVCVTGRYEGLYYIDNDDFHVYRRSDDLSDYPETALLRELDFNELTSGDWIYDEEGTGNEHDDVIECFIDDFTRMFPKFDRPEAETYIGRSDRKVLLESKLFYIAEEDNEWSVAIELIQKEEPYGAVWMENLQGLVYEKYLSGMKKCLLNRLPSIGIYKGAWTSGTLRKEDLFCE